MNVRVRRLEGDWAAVQAALRDHPRIEIASTAGRPPQRYHIRYRVKGLEEKPDGTIVEKDEHLAEVSLLRSYPSQPPMCRMLTPVFHPNIAPHAICIGDQWSAGEPLVHLIFRIGEMLAYQSYNIKSPLNGQAAKWVEENLARLPIDDFPLAVPEEALTTLSEGPAGPDGGAGSCDKCDTLHKATELWRCPSGHQVCARCRTACMACGGSICTICGPQRCAVCFQNFCVNCSTTCSACGRSVCAAHGVRCERCGEPTCQSCLVRCAFCGMVVCVRHLAECALCGKRACAEHVAGCTECGAAVCLSCSTDCQVCGARICRNHVTMCPGCQAFVCPAHFDRASGQCAKCGGDLPVLGEPAAEEETIIFACPACGVKLSAQRIHVGLSIVCPKCGTDCAIPAATEST